MANTTTEQNAVREAGHQACSEFDHDHVRSEIRSALSKNECNNDGELNIYEVAVYLDAEKGINVSNLPWVQDAWNEELSKFRCE